MRLASLAIGTALALLLAEAALRIARPELARVRTPEPGRAPPLGPDAVDGRFYVADPVLGWRHAPGARRAFRIGRQRYEYRFNSQGMHDVEHAPAPGPGVFRIVLLGDSQAVALVDLERSHPRLAETCLNRRRAPGAPRVEIVNLGVAGYGFSQNLSMLERYGMAQRPHLVLLQANPWNDYLDEFPQFMDYLWDVPVRYTLENGALASRRAPLAVEPPRPSSLHLLLFDRSALYRFYANLAARQYYYERSGGLSSLARRLGLEFKPPGLPLLELKQLQRALDRETADFDPWGPRWNAKTRRVLASVEAILERMSEVARSGGAGFAIFANPLVAHGRFESDPLVAVMAARLGIPFLDVNQRLRDSAEPGADLLARLTFWEDGDGHFNEAGNGVLARMVCDWLLADPRLAP